MAIGKIVAYAVVAALSFGGGYATHYYVHNTGINYTIEIGKGKIGIKKHEGIDGIVDDLVDEARKRLEDGKKEVRRFVEEHAP